MDGFNDHNFLCHYGIKGMKWGVRRYETANGHLTEEGKLRYGSKHGLKKAIRKEIKTSNRLTDEVLTRREALKYSEKLSEKADAKYAKKQKEKYRIRSEAAKENISLQKRELQKAEKARREHYNKLVKEFGKTAISEISYDEDKAKILSSDAMSAAYASIGWYSPSYSEIGSYIATGEMRQIAKRMKKESKK
jgi:hypothetical protein